VVEKAKNDWEMFKRLCPECQKVEVYTVGPNRSEFCSNQCERNYNFRKERFSGTEKEKWISSEKARKF